MTSMNNPMAINTQMGMPYTPPQQEQGGGQIAQQWLAQRGQEKLVNRQAEHEMRVAELDDRFKRDAMAVQGEWQGKQMDWMDVMFDKNLAEGRFRFDSHVKSQQEQMTFHKLQWAESMKYTTELAKQAQERGDKMINMIGDLGKQLTEQITARGQEQQIQNTIQEVTRASMEVSSPDEAVRFIDGQQVGKLIKHHGGVEGLKAALVAGDIKGTELRMLRASVDALVEGAPDAWDNWFKNPEARKAIEKLVRSDKGVAKLAELKTRLANNQAPWGELEEAAKGMTSPSGMRSMALAAVYPAAGAAALAAHKAPRKLGAAGYSLLKHFFWNERSPISDEDTQLLDLLEKEGVTDDQMKSLLEYTEKIESLSALQEYLEFGANPSKMDPEGAKALLAMRQGAWLDQSQDALLAFLRPYEGDPPTMDELSEYLANDFTTTNEELQGSGINLYGPRISNLGE